MRSFKDWKLMKESLGSSLLGISSLPSVGVVGSIFDEAKKKAKKMGAEDVEMDDEEAPEEEVPADDDGEEEAPEVDVDADTDTDGEEDSPCGPKMACKKSKKKMKKEGYELSDSDRKFFDTLMRQVGGETRQTKFESGLSPEMKFEEEPKPGEVGFAPFARIGESTDNSEINAVMSALQGLYKHGRSLDTTLAEKLDEHISGIMEIHRIVGRP